MRHNDYNFFVRNLKVFPKFYFCKDTKFILTLKLRLYLGYTIRKKSVLQKKFEMEMPNKKNKSKENQHRRSIRI